jgi:hypothetical protein
MEKENLVVLGYVMVAGIFAAWVGERERGDGRGCPSARMISGNARRLSCLDNSIPIIFSLIGPKRCFLLALSMSD